MARMCCPFPSRSLANWLGYRQIKDHRSRNDKMHCATLWNVHCTTNRLRLDELLRTRYYSITVEITQSARSWIIAIRTTESRQARATKCHDARAKVMRTCMTKFIVTRLHENTTTAHRSVEIWQTIPTVRVNLEPKCQRPHWCSLYLCDMTWGPVFKTS